MTTRLTMLTRTFINLVKMAIGAKRTVSIVLSCALLTIFMAGCLSMNENQAVAEIILETLNGTWVQTANSPMPYSITIHGSKIFVTWGEGKKAKVLCDSTFRLEGDELKNMKLRKDWEAYDKPHQYEAIGHFSSLHYQNGALVGFIFVADMGYYPVQFIKTLENSQP